jgi:ribonucleoside-diphosphate reductase alpha chain
MAAQQPLTEEISRHIWRTKYRYRTAAGEGDRTIEDTWRRIATALAAVEPQDRELWAARFYGILEGLKFLPAGRIQAGAGTPHQVTLFNCFVMGVVEDSIESIFDNLKEGALTLQQGGGVGYDFSTLRPRGTRARDAGTIASGPVSFMHVWDAMCATMLSTGARRGAMMATLRCDHPDIEEFITAKHEPGRLRHFNLSVQVTDAFMAAVREGAEWPLVFPAAALASGGAVVERLWTGGDAPLPCRVVRSAPARALWTRSCARPTITPSRGSCSSTRSTA